MLLSFWGFLRPLYVEKFWSDSSLCLRRRLRSYGFGVRRVLWAWYGTLEVEI